MELTRHVARAAGLATVLATGIASGSARAQIVEDSSLIDPAAQLVDFEGFALGAVSNPLTLGNATFSAGPGLGVASLVGKGANGTEVEGNALIPFPEDTLPTCCYTPMTITFTTPVSEAGFGWYDPNGKNNTLTALDAAGNVLAEGNPQTGPSGGCCAAFIGVVWPTADIKTLIVTPHKGSDFYAVDNLLYFPVGSFPPPYCSATASTEGCLASITTSDPTSQPISGLADYQVFANDVQGLRNGSFLYSLTGPDTIPFMGGILCVAAPVGRTPVRYAAGSAAACDGSIAVTVNDSSPWDPGPGGTVWMQGWYRDPQSVDGAASSNAIRLDFQ